MPLPRLNPIALLAGVLSAATVPAASPAFAIEAKSGVETAVAAFYVIRTDCTGGGGQRASIRVPPANGTARLALMPWKVPEGRRCAGMQLKASVLLYRSRTGFRGTDTVTVETIHEQYLDDPVSDVYSTDVVSIQVR